MNFTCPYCNRVTTITDPNISNDVNEISTNESIYQNLVLGHQAIACPNSECKQLSLKVWISKHRWSQGFGWRVTDKISEWNLLPNSLAKPQPNFIPKALRDDYYEACSILQLSPKASATLSRRCLQGVVRDFWSLDDNKKGKLAAELKQVKDKIDEDTWAGIEAIVTVGNVGAHMENDVNYVVDVEIEEAELLIELIEMLFDDWYVLRQRRRDRAQKAKAVAANKIQEKRDAKKASRASDGKGKT